MKPVIENIEVTYAIGEEIKVAKGDLIATEGGPFSQFCVIGVSEDKQFCINWDQVITMDVNLPDMFMVCLSDITEGFHMHKAQEEMSKVDFQQRVEARKMSNALDFQ